MKKQNKIFLTLGLLLGTLVVTSISTFAYLEVTNQLPAITSKVKK